MAKKYNTEIDWQPVCDAYETRTPPPSVYEIAKEFGIAYETIRGRAEREVWRRKFNDPSIRTTTPPQTADVIEVPDSVRPDEIALDISSKAAQSILFLFGAAFVDKCLAEVNRLIVLRDTGLTASDAAPAPNAFAALGISKEEDDKRSAAMWFAVTGGDERQPQKPGNDKERCQNKKCGEKSLMLHVYRGIKLPDGILKIPSTCSICGKMNYQYYKLSKTELVVK